MKNMNIPRQHKLNHPLSYAHMLRFWGLDKDALGTSFYSQGKDAFCRSPWAPLQGIG